MRFIHTGDLHIGKTVNEFDLWEDQRYILDSIYHIAVDKAVDCIIIAGDIYDRSVPKTEAVKLLDEFFQRVASAGIKIFAIAGNHDSKERLSFGASIMEKGGLFIKGEPEQVISPYTVEDEYGKVNVFLLPFTKPVYVEKMYGMPKLSFEEAVRECIKHMDMNIADRNIIVTHQFITNGGAEPETSESETDINIGGVANVDVSVFKTFDYAALGHIHRRCRIGDGNVYYSGSPLKYSFSEVYHKKSVNLVEIRSKGEVTVEYIDLKPVRDMREIKGELRELTSQRVAEMSDRQDYIRAVLTDNEDLYEPMEALRQVYPNVMQIVVAKRQPEADEEFAPLDMESKSPLELFKEFYRAVNGEDIGEEKKCIIEEVIEKAKEVQG